MLDALGEAAEPTKGRMGMNTEMTGSNEVKREVGVIVKEEKEETVVGAIKIEPSHHPELQLTQLQIKPESEGKDLELWGISIRTQR